MIDAIESIRVNRQLFSDVFRAHENALEMSPSSLHLKPNGDNCVGHHQLLLPSRHFTQKVSDEL